MRKILIIEDDQRLTLALCVRFKAHGYATWVASDSIDGLATALREKPDLILLDLALPAGHGFELAKELRQHAETRRTPIIVATASTDPNLRTATLKLGAAALIRKPYDPATLLMIVQGALGDAPLGTLQALAARTEPPPQKAKPATILVVEDDERVAQAITLRLNAAGFQTATAGDAVSALRLALEIEPEAVVLDISLPGGDGFTVAERIQANLHKPTPIVFLTASKRPDLREKARQLGAVGFLEKPYAPEALLATLSRAVLAQTRSQA
jgi:DNA-binding response OmpR family regulator